MRDGCIVYPHMDNIQTLVKTTKQSSRWSYAAERQSIKRDYLITLETGSLTGWALTAGGGVTPNILGGGIMAGFMPGGGIITANTQRHSRVLIWRYTFILDNKYLMLCIIKQFILCQLHLMHWTNIIIDNIYYVICIIEHWTDYCYKIHNVGSVTQCIILKTMCIVKVYVIL